MRGFQMNIEEIYLFTGTEEVRKKAKMEQILAQVSDKEISITKYDLDYTSIQTVIADAITVPFLSDLKVLILKNPNFLANKKSQVKHDINAFIKYLKRPTETTVLFIDAVGLEIDRDLEVYKVLQKTAYINNTKELDDIEFKAWIKRNFAKENVDIKEDALVLLIEYVKHNLIRMEQEIQKLIDYAAFGGRITEKEVEALVCKDLDIDIFALINAIINKDRTTVMSIYNDLSHNTKDTTNILALIGSSFTDLLITNKLLVSGYSQNDVAEVLKVSTNRAFYLVRDAKTFKTDALEECVKKIALVDYQIKSGLIDRDHALELLLLGI